MKKCTKCSEVKSFDSFSRCSAAGDGLQWWCKSCLSNRQKIGRIYNKENIAISRKKWNAKNRQKCNAHHSVHRKIKRNGMVRLPCSVCGDSKAEAHHEDYSDRFNVVWLCKKHHAARHTELKMEEKGV